MEIFFLIVYFFTMIILGVFSFFKIKNNNDFYLAGEKSGTLAISGSLLATILGSSAILGTVNLSFSKGWASSWWIICAIIGLLVLLPLSKKVKKFGKFTLPQLIGDFYGSEAEIISSMIIPIAWIGVVAAQIIGSSKILVSFFEMDYSLGVLITGSIFIIYTILGGQKSIIKTDIIQFLFILAGIFIIFIFAINSKDHQTTNMTDLNFPINKNFGIFDLIVLLLTTSTTYFVGPDIYSRIFCAKDEKTAQNSVLITILALIPFAFILSFLGVFAKANFDIDIRNSAALIDVAFNILPKWGIGLMAAALLSAVMSSADTTLLTASTIFTGFFTDIKKDKSIIITRLFIFILGVISILFSLYVRSIIGSLLIAFAVFSGAFIIPTVAGLLKYRTTKIQIISAILSGGFIALAGKLISISSKIPNNIISGNIIIISAFVVNAVILFFPKIKKNK